MKKRLSLLLSIMLVLTFILPVMGYASEHDKELEEAIVKAKELFDITNEYDDFNYSINTYNGITEYYLNWSDSNQKLGHINVSIDSDGFIRNYNNYKNSNGRYEKKLPEISKEEGLKIAKDFIKKANPEIATKIEYQENNRPLNPQDRYYYYSFIRTENGVPFYNTNINVTVDNIDGHIESFYCNWDKRYTFPDNENIISLEEAKEIFKEEIGLELVYKLNYENDRVEPYLVYTLLNNNKTIDAKTGEVIENSNYYYADDAMAKESVAMDRGSSPELSPAEKEKIESASNIMSRKDAEDYSRLFLEIDDEYELRYLNLYTDWRYKDEYTWNLDFFKETSKDGQRSGLNAYISLDAKTGEVKSFNKYLPYNQDDKVKYNKEEALELAKEYIKKVQPEKFDKVEYQEIREPIYEPLDEQEKPRQYYFNFIRKENNAYFQGNGFNVTIDTVNGNIISYNYTWHKGQLPSTDEIISLEKAYDVMFDEIGMNLEYIVKQPYYYDGYRTTDKQEDLYKAILVYNLDRTKPVNIDPVTEEIVDSNGKPYKENITKEYTDIENSYAKDQIKVLTQYGISLPGNEFKPSIEINQRDFLYLIAKANYPYLNLPEDDMVKLDKNLYDLLIREGIVKENEKSPEAVVTKEEAVKYIIRALRYDKIADIKGIYTVPFDDVDQINSELKGYVAIAYGLNIVNGSNGYFNPTTNLTREQAAIVIYNYLSGN